ncbi:MAG TPA: HAMP domain-containing sensor histidine kinase, partial [Candidatus Elarobacter sp.]|nr:HAMP domain-containing sensor histidine kinase [Candidatus Elarobacter sp.]
MFGSFARRLTGWYVVGAVILMLAVSGAFGVVGMLSYVHVVQDGVDADAREAQAFGARAVARHEAFVPAAIEIEKRLARPGIRMAATGHLPRDRDQRGPARPKAFSVPLLMRVAPPTGNGRPDGGGPPRFGGTPPPTVIDGRVTHLPPGPGSVTGSRMGFALGTAFGAHLQRVDIGNGDMRIYPDPDATERVAFLILALMVLFSVVAGVLAWLIGRYITSQVLHPLVEVTHALQRFATRDFTPQPIAVAGKSEFDAIAVAYNAAAAQVAAAFAERAQAETQMRQFVADAGHELRTPLTIVLGYIDLLRRRADDDERSRRIFTSIATEGGRMRTLIDNLVLLARMEGDDVRPPEPFALCPLLEQIVEGRKLIHPEAQLRVECAVDANVIGNETEIHEAIANVVDNAIKYAPGAPIRIVASAADGGIDVRVVDRGPGIHPNDRAGIFDRFYRGATRGDVEGSGLG